MKIGKMREMQPCACLNCGKVTDAASSVGTEATPEPGDISICLYCGHIMAFTDALTMRELNDEEIVRIAGDLRIVAIQTARKKVFEK
jgi:hypothetical protein